MSRSRQTVAAFALLAVIAACSSSGPQSAASSPAAMNVPDVEGPMGLPSTTGLVVSQSPLGSDIGAEILRKGGNAVDAAIATAFAMVVTNPSNANLGGGGFMMVRLPNGKTEAIDFREKAPIKATASMYVNPATGASAWKAAGYLAPGVPGTVAGMWMAHERYGKLPWKDLVMPAAELAAKGIVSPTLGSALNRMTEGTGRMVAFPASMKNFRKAGGAQWQPTDTLKFPDLSKTMIAIANGGRDVFYKGWIADSISADMARNGGLISKEDLARYQAIVRVPIKVTYKGYELAMMPPPSGGGVILAEALNILENYDLKSMGQTSPQAVHLVLEAMQRGFLDRARYLGDPDFNPDMPIAQLTSKAYAKQLAAGISPTKASVSADLGKDIMAVGMRAEGTETTHYTTIDKNGMAVSVTYTLESGYGAFVVVPGAGFLLNNEMGDFNRVPGLTDGNGSVGTLPNRVGPEKRMLSSMNPTIVTKNGKVVLITGSPGGRSIPSTVLGVLLSFMEFGHNGREAVDGPRIDHEWMPDRGSVETTATPAIPQATLDALTAMGHQVRAGGGGEANSIWVDTQTGIVYGVNDKRNRSSKASKG